MELNAKDSVFYVALFKDPDGTKRCSDVKAIHIQNGISASAVFENVTKGIYYVFETDADGTAVPFEVLVNDEKGNMYYCIGENTEAITITPEEAKEENAELYNWYMDVPDNFYLTGKIQITKNVRKAGKIITTGETFYAGIFDEDDNLVRVEELKENDTITVDLPLGGESGTEPVTYTVKETTVTPTPTSEITPTVTPVSQGTISGDNSGNHSAINAKTGDETKTGVYVLLLMLSVAILAYGRRKHKKDL